MVQAPVVHRAGHRPVPAAPRSAARPYARPHDPRFPVACFGERPCFLPGGVAEGPAPRPGKPAKGHGAYTEHGSCRVPAAVEPLTGQRLYQGRARYTRFVQQVAARCPRAETSRLGQDNLNTHALSTFYDCLPAAVARRRGPAPGRTFRGVLHAQVRPVAQPN